MYRRLIEKSNEIAIIEELFQAIKDAVVMTDKDGKIIFWNKGATKIFGYEEKEIIGKNIEMLIPQRYKLKHQAGVEASQKRGRCEYLGKIKETVGLRKDGSEIPLEISFSSWKKNDELIFLNIIRDITERKKALKELKEERELFIDGPVVVFKWKAGERHVPVEYVSPNVKEMFGYNPKDFISGKIKYDSIIHSDDLKRVLKEAELNKNKSHYEQEYRIIDAKGRVRWVYDFTLIKKNERGKITHYHGYIIDITEKKMMEEKLKEGQQQLLSIFNGIDEPIYVADPSTHQILFANRSIKSMFGKDIIGKKCYKVLQNLDKPCEFCTNDRIMGKNFGRTFVWEFQNKKNKRWYRCIDRGITWPDGRKVRMEIAIDITDKIKAEENMRIALEKEKEFKMRAAHFFFNPIAIAKGYLHLILDEHGNDNDISPKVKKAIGAIDRIEKVVKNVTQKGKISE